MDWLDIIVYVLYGCGALIVLLFATNLLLVKKRMTSMQERTDELQMQLADLKRIQKAKSLLQRQLGMSEQDAHRWIEKAAMDRCVKKREIAETVIRLYDT